MFHVGQKVVCINADINNANARPIDLATWQLVKGKVYTIRALLNEPTTGPTLLVEEIPDRDPYGTGLFEAGYFRWRFRPLVERKTSIEVFKRMLNRTPNEGSKHLRELEKEKEPT